MKEFLHFVCERIVLSQLAVQPFWLVTRWDDSHTQALGRKGCFSRLVFLKAICAFFFSSRITLESLGVFFQQPRGNRSLKIRRFEFPVGLFRSHESMRIKRFPRKNDQPIVGIDGYTSHPPAEDGAGSAGEHGCRGFLVPNCLRVWQCDDRGTCLRPNA